MIQKVFGALFVDRCFEVLKTGLKLLHFLQHVFNDELEIYWLHNSSEDLKVSGRWQAQARSNLRELIYNLRRQLALDLLKQRSKRDPRKIVDEWLATPWGEGRHADRVAKITAVEHRYAGGSP